MIPDVAWYKEWFGSEYLELYSHRDRGEAEAHIRFVLEVLGDTNPKAVLDLACGAGRHTQALRERGVRTLGIDLSLILLLQPPRFPSVSGDLRGAYNVEIERWFDARTERVNKRIRVLASDRNVQTFLESVRAYSTDEVQAALKSVGLEVDELFGGFSGEEFRSDSERLILVGHKPG